MGKDKKPSSYEVLLAFFDEGSFVELDALYTGSSQAAEAVTGFGTVDGMPAYAFAQNTEVCGGAMSKAHSAKITKLYNAALKTGAPVVGFYDSIGGRLDQGNDLLAAYGDILRKASTLSGVVPQISVVLGKCVGTSALIARSADFVIMTQDAVLTLNTASSSGSAEENLADGSAQFVADSCEDVIDKAKALLSYLPTNNLEAAPAYEPLPPADNPDKLPKYIADDGSLLCVGSGEGVCTAFGRVDGATVGFVVSHGEEITSDTVKKIARHVRFCDAFSIPVITIADAGSFTDLNDASSLVSVYADATTAKISVISGTAYGAVYLALAGSACGADLVYALDNATVSPISPEAAAYLMDPLIADLPYGEQDAAIKAYIRANLTAQKAAEDGYVDAVVDKTELREKIAAALRMLSSKRVTTLPKKHSTIL